MFINVIIPVCSLHIKYIKTIINSIKAQTRKPDKVIFVLNEYSRYEDAYEEIIEDNNDYFYIKIDTWKTAGENRNIGYTEVIQSDDSIILFFDVDDIMSHILCEVVEYVFVKYKCDLLIYGSSRNKNKLINDYPNKNINKNDTNFPKNNKEILIDFIKSKIIRPAFPDYKAKYIDELLIHPNITHDVFQDKEKKNNVIKFKIAAGECAVSYKVIKNKTYFANISNGEDRHFIAKVTYKYKNTYILPIVLSQIVGNEHIRIENKQILQSPDKIILDYKPVL